MPHKLSMIRWKGAWFGVFLSGTDVLAADRESGEIADVRFYPADTKSKEIGARASEALARIIAAEARNSFPAGWTWAPACIR